MLDEGQRFLDPTVVKRDKEAERLVLHCQAAVLTGYWRATSRPRCLAAPRSRGRPYGPRQVRAGMAGDIVRQGRSVLMFLIAATQKATTDSLPSQIRDNAALSIALAQKTRAACKAALGDDIADYESFLPPRFRAPNTWAVRSPACAPARTRLPGCGSRR